MYISSSRGYWSVVSDRSGTGDSQRRSWGSSKILSFLQWKETGCLLRIFTGQAFCYVTNKSWNQTKISLNPRPPACRSTFSTRHFHHILRTALRVPFLMWKGGWGIGLTLVQRGKKRTTARHGTLKYRGWLSSSLTPLSSSRCGREAL